MACISSLPYEILLSGGTPAQCEKIIRERSDDVYRVGGGYTIRGVMLRGDDIPIGTKGDELFFQYVKPCYGLFVLRLPDASDEVKKLQALFAKK